jgi:hypothetical protein
MTRKLTLFAVCAFEIGLILFVAAHAAWAELNSSLDCLKLEEPPFETIIKWNCADNSIEQVLPYADASMSCIYKISGQDSFLRSQPLEKLNSAFRDMLNDFCLSKQDGSYLEFASGVYTEQKAFRNLYQITNNPPQQPPRRVTPVIIG